MPQLGANVPNLGGNAPHLGINITLPFRQVLSSTRRELWMLLYEGLIFPC
jgi:hypothetical protein